MLRLNGISKSFGGLKATDDLSLDFKAGPLSAIIGPNGAGKTTLFNLITGRLVPDAGTIELDGENITGRSPAEIVRSHVRLTLQPVDAPPRPDQLERLLEHMGSDELLLFSTDYPHWQFDGASVLPEGLPAGLVRKIMVDNPRTTYPRLTEDAR